MIDNNYNNIDITYMSIEDIKNITDKLITAPNINALVATPQISSIAGYWNSGASYGQIIVLWKNTLARGWVKIEAGNQTGMVVLGTHTGCYDPILPLGYLETFGITSSFDHAFARTWYCPIGATENCTAVTCSSPSIQETNTNDTMYAYVSGSPGTPGGLSVSPGDGQLRIQWNAVSGLGGGGDIFAYSVMVQGDKTILGYVPPNLINITVGNLTNYVTYSVEVRALTNSYKFSTTPATGSGSPRPACATMGVPTLTIP